MLLPFCVIPKCLKTIPYFCIVLTTTQVLCAKRLFAQRGATTVYPAGGWVSLPAYSRNRTRSTIAIAIALKYYHLGTSVRPSVRLYKVQVLTFLGHCFTGDLIVQLKEKKKKQQNKE